jgi:hypothetical protein
MIIAVEACTNLANPIWSAAGTNTFTIGSSHNYRALNYAPFRTDPFLAPMLGW